MSAPTVEQYLRNFQTLLKDSKQGDGYTWLLEHGRAFETKPLPEDVSYGYAKQCYANALHVVMDNEERYRYCEGIAYTPGLIPCAHAWVLDTEDGKVFDPTWRDGGSECGFCLGTGGLMDDDDESDTYGDETTCGWCNGTGKVDHEHPQRKGCEYFGIVIEDAIERTMSQVVYGVLERVIQDELATA